MADNKSGKTDIKFPVTQIAELIPTNVASYFGSTYLGLKTHEIQNIKGVPVVTRFCIIKAGLELWINRNPQQNNAKRLLRMADKAYISMNVRMTIQPEQELASQVDVIARSFTFDEWKRFSIGYLSVYEHEVQAALPEPADDHGRALRESILRTWSKKHKDSRNKEDIIKYYESFKDILDRTVSDGLFGRESIIQMKKIIDEAVGLKESQKDSNKAATPAQEPTEDDVFEDEPASGAPPTTPEGSLARTSLQIIEDHTRERHCHPCINDNQFFDQPNRYENVMTFFDRLAGYIESERIRKNSKNPGMPRPIGVAVLDSGLNDSEGIYPDCPDGPADGEFWVVKKRVNCVGTTDKNTADDCNHGTDVVRIIMKYAPFVKLYIIKILENRNNKPQCPEPNVLIKALKYVRDQKDIDIVNMSFSSEKQFPEYRKLLSELGNEKVLLAAAGNDPNNYDHGFKAWYPAQNNSVIAVGAHEQHKRICGFSANADFVDFLCPGENINVSLGTPRTSDPSGQASAEGSGSAPPKTPGVEPMQMDDEPDALVVMEPAAPAPAPANTPSATTEQREMSETRRVVSGTSYAVPHATATVALCLRYADWMDTINPLPAYLGETRRSLLCCSENMQRLLREMCKMNPESYLYLNPWEAFRSEAGHFRAHLDKIIESCTQEFS